MSPSPSPSPEQQSDDSNNNNYLRKGRFGVGLARERNGSRRELGFLSVSLSVKGSQGVDGCSVGSAEVLSEDWEKETVDAAEEKKEVKKVKGSSGAMNMTKHLWAGAVAAMVSRSKGKIHANSLFVPALAWDVCCAS
ncbi:hypothetical protein MLD38_001675 [Melastoma candidum]|uniref:Uncharacterized protein n=1 Tax=Melastoma candidum TaxID=119954 RepID=A0ACB9SIX6_9MYRT|nr:hypothetical protein MLD38_001675 [Melastoma candidum]